MESLPSNLSRTAWSLTVNLKIRVVMKHKSSGTCILPEASTGERGDILTALALRWHLSKRGMRVRGGQREGKDRHEKDLTPRESCGAVL